MSINGSITSIVSGNISLSDVQVDFTGAVFAIKYNSTALLNSKFSYSVLYNINL